MIPYNDQLDARQQVGMEEKIAAYLADFDRITDTGLKGPTDEDLNRAGKDILYMVLREFRPDLFGEIMPKPDQSDNQFTKTQNEFYKTTGEDCEHNCSGECGLQRMKCLWIFCPKQRRASE
jgi:hypothetical protein